MHKKPYRRSLATLTKLVESHQAKWKLIKPEMISLKRKNTTQSVKIEKLQYTIETLRTLLKDKQSINKEASIEVIKITKILKSKVADILQMEVQIKELKQDKRNLTIRLKDKDKDKIKLAKLDKQTKQAKYTPENWKSYIPAKPTEPTKVAKPVKPAKPDPTKYTQEYWKSLYMSEIKRK